MYNSAENKRAQPAQEVPTAGEKLLPKEKLKKS
jgi:hypothetical protein